MYRLFLWKRWVEDLLMFPLILLGRLWARLRPLDREYETFFFFPFYHIGGAEKVHAAVAQATGNGNCIIFFTRKSQNDLFYEEFRRSGCTLRDISKWTDNKWIYFVNIFFRGLVTGYINRQKGSTLVFNGQCNFGYKISPWVRRDIPQVELIHSLCSFSYIRIPFLPFITRTVMISTIRIQEHLDLYRRFSIPASLGDRIEFIMNGIELPQRTPVQEQPKNEALPFTVLYVGRGTPEKRVDLVALMARELNQQQKPVSVQFLGEVREAIPADLHSFVHFWGNQSDPETIDRIYRQAQVLILVSDTEGFPMVVMEAMARGLAIISTAVGELPLHIREGVNGFLISEVTDREAVVRQGCEKILRLEQNRQELEAIGQANIADAYAQFGLDRFRDSYQQLFHRLRTKHPS